MQARLVLALVMLLGLAGCGSQQAGYQITDRNHSIAVMREQQYPGSAWTNHVVVARYPECQRRYPLKESPGIAFKLDVYRIEQQVYVLNHGKRWYIAETGACRWQQYEEEPPEPGELIGTFQVKNEVLTWIDKAPKKDEAADKSATKPAK